MKNFNENNLTEQSLIEWLQLEGYERVYGPDINPGQPNAEREDFREVVLSDRLLGAIQGLNPKLPKEQAEQVAKEVSNFHSPDLIQGNKEIYEMIVDGIKKTWKTEDGNEKTEIVKLIDFKNPETNDFRVVNQFTVQGKDKLARFDVVVFVNGLPLGLFELKNPVSGSANIGEAYRQINDYKENIQKIFFYNQVIGLSDLVNARHGAISASWERYGTWKGIEKEESDSSLQELEILAKGLFNKNRFLDLIQNFIVFEADGDSEAVTYTKKMAMYHQFYGVNKTVESTKKAINGEQDRKIGVFWHTQGSGKSLSMVFYVNKVKRIEELKSPAYVFLTDRDDLDTQLFRTFKRSGYSTLAKKARSIKDLKEKLSNIGSELIFTTVQKFQGDPDTQKALTKRENIIVIADEAHRTQYKTLAGNARNALPNASFLGITGTPISERDRDTLNVFGDVVSSYKISQAVKDGATVPIYYEGRLAPLHIADKFLDSKLDDILGEIGTSEKARMRQEWAILEEIISAPSRINKIAKDVVNHFNERPIQGKAMIVTMSRRIAVSMYEAINKISKSPECAVVISNSDEFADRIQKERDPKNLEKRFKKTNDPLKIVIVCDMWLTGFDVPNLHTMYLDKPLKNHGLMQAIARVNRVFKDKPGGLIVDYIGIADNLKEALSIYDSDIQKETMIPISEIESEMMRLYKRAVDFFSDVDFSEWKTKKGIELSEILNSAVNAVISENGVLSDEKKMEYMGVISKLSRLHALAMPGREALNILSDIQFLQSVREAINKQTVIPKVVFPKETESAIRSLIQNSIKAESLIDLFSDKNKKHKNISIFDEKFAEEIKKTKFKNLAIDAMRRLLNEEISVRQRINKARYETMLTLISELIEKYENNIINSTEIIKRLLEIADEVKKLDKESKELGLSEEEVVFYDYLLEDPDLKQADIDVKQFVEELVKRIRRDLTIDWTNNETIKARIRQNVRLLLLQKGIIEEVKMKRLIESIYQEVSRVYKEYVPV